MPSVYLPQFLMQLIETGERQMQSGFTRRNQTRDACGNAIIHSSTLVRASYSDGALTNTATIFVTALRAILQLPATWWQRIRFRAQLRADMVDAADFLHDIGIDLFDAQAEAMRFFWEPVTLTRPQSTSPDIASGVGVAPSLGMDSLGMDKDLRAEKGARKVDIEADIAKAARCESKSDLEVG